MTTEPHKIMRVNPLDSMMTKAQVVRRKFKSALPRSIQNRLLSRMEAMARTMELFDRLRTMMREAGLNEDDVAAGLVFTQPETPGLEHIEAQSTSLPAPDQIGHFVETIMALDRPIFLGLLFVQHDREAEKEDKKLVAFIWPFMTGPTAEKALIGVRNKAARGGGLLTN